MAHTVYFFGRRLGLTVESMVNFFVDQFEGGLLQSANSTNFFFQSSSDSYLNTQKRPHQRESQYSQIAAVSFFLMSLS